MTAPTLFVAAPLQRFNQQQLSELQRRLTVLESRSRIESISQVEDLLLDHRGVVHPAAGDGFRFTRHAFHAVCRVASGGLFRLLDEVSGQCTRKEIPASACRFPLAVDIFNSVVKLRFDALFRDTQQLTWNYENKLIESLIGPRFAMLGNVDFLDLALDVAGAVDVPLRFHEATLNGRRLRLRFVTPSPLFSVPVADGTEHAFHGGMYFENSELGGDVSVRGGLLVSRLDVGLWALEPIVDNRVQHIGKNMRARVVRMTKLLLGRAPALLPLGNQIRQLAKTRLGLTAPDHRSARFGELRRILRSLGGLTVATAEHILLSAIQHGVRTPKPNLPAPPTVEEAASRTVYDVFCAICRESLVRSVADRERLERLAYRLADGEFSLAKQHKD